MFKKELPDPDKNGIIRILPVSFAERNKQLL